MRVTKPIDTTSAELENAKETAITLFKEKVSKSAMDLFYTGNLEELENGIRQLNDLSQKSWLLSALLLYTLIYNKDLCSQSGLKWAEYAKQSRERLGIDQRVITDQLAAARFFIKYHKALEKRGFDPVGANAKLSRAELALSLTGDLNAVLDHVVDDTWSEFKQWYQSFKHHKSLPQDTTKRNDISVFRNKFKIGSVEAVKVSDEIPDADKQRLQNYMKTIFKALADGKELAIIPVQDKKEAKNLELLKEKQDAEKNNTLPKKSNSRNS